MIYIHMRTYAAYVFHVLATNINILYHYSHLYHNMCSYSVYCPSLLNAQYIHTYIPLWFIYKIKFALYIHKS